jgi:tetratricopeptide (TPR) repeat protein/CHAT domain-containing protein
MKARLRLRVLLVALALCAAVPPDHRLAAASSAGQIPDGSTVPAADQAAIRLVIDAYFAAYAREDISALRALCHPASVECQSKANVVSFTFLTEDAVFSNLRVARWTVGRDGPTARVLVDATITNTRRKEIANQAWTRNFGVRMEAGEWRVWHEASAVEDLALELSRLTSLPAQLALLDQDPDLLTDELRLALSRRAMGAMASGAKATIALLKLALHVAERTKVPASIAAAWLDLGLQYEATGDLADALEGFDKALASFTALGNRERIAATEMNLAGVLYRMATNESVEETRIERYSLAAEHYRKAFDAFEALGETGWRTSILHSLGNTSYSLGRWDEALDFYRRTLDIQEQALAAAGPAPTMLQQRGVASAHQAVGMVLKEQGDYPSAIAALERARARYKAYDDRSGVSNVERQIGECYRAEGAFGHAVRHLLGALEVAGQIRADARDAANEARILAAIGEIYGLQQRYAAALDYFGRSLALVEKTRNRESLADVIGGIGGVHFLRGALDEALDHYRRSLAIREELGDMRACALTLAQIGLVLAAQDKHDESRATFEKSLLRAQASGGGEAAAIALALLASADAALGKPDSALELAARAAAQGADAGSPDVVARSKLVAGDAHRLRGELDRAEAAVREAIVTVERLKAAGTRADERFFGDTIAPYLSMVSLLVEQKRTDDAFVVLERARQVRMQALLEDAVIAKGLSPEENEEERRLRKRVVTLRAQVRKANGQPGADRQRLARLSDDLTAAVEAQQVFETRLYQSHPDLRVLRARAGQELLPAGAEPVVDGATAVLEYAVTENATYLFALTREPAKAAGGVRTRTSPAAPLVVRVYTIAVKPTDLVRRVAAFREALAASATDIDLPARDLYDLLLAPAAAQVAGARRLLVVPDGILWALPFQALRSPEGRYVIEDRAVAYGGSLAALAAVARSERRVPPAQGPRVAAFGLASPGPAAAALLALLRPDVKLLATAQAEREAQDLALPSAPGAVRARVGPEAQAEKARQAAATAPAIHLAVPALLVDASPMHSPIAFAPQTEGSGRDGLVETAQVMEWDVASRLVVLTRVHGDPGAQNAGAAARAMAWAWFVAGAPATVLTQWVVDTPHTSVLMRGFHRRLLPASGTPPRPSEALRQAILSTLAGSGRHPFHWAGFTVMGDGR